MAVDVLGFGAPAGDAISEGLPIGNGSLGALVLGRVGTEVVCLNEKTLWTGGPGSADGYDFGNWAAPRPGALTRVRRLLDEHGSLPPEVLAERLGRPKRGFGAYQPLGDLILRQDDRPDEGPVEDYRRELDLGRAVATTSWTRDGVRHTREHFASFPAGVIVVRVAADRPGRVDLGVAFTAPGNRSRSGSTQDGRVTVRGALHDNGLRYEVQLLVRAEGGTRTDGDDGTVTVRGADAVTVIVAAGTDYAPVYPDYRGADPHDRVTAAIDGAAGTSYAALRKAHEEDHRRLYDRVALDLPGSEREALFFQYGRYLLIASSREGSLPANLQGVWNVDTAPAWDADYHVNINLQMNYWPAEVTNLAETAGPLFDFVDALVPPGRVTASEMFGHRGWVVHNELNPYGFSGVHDWPTAFWFPEAGAWLARHYWEHYRFRPDERFLRGRAYPVMRELATFWLDDLVVDPRDGRLVVSPSFSPEHGEVTAGAAMSQQIVADLFTTTAAAAGILGDTAFRDELHAALARLDPGLRVGAWGQLQEWKDDRDDRKDEHRHVSHLYALHPGDGLGPQHADAARVSLDARGDGGTGWSRAWRISFRARLGDGDQAHRMLLAQLRHSTLANLFDTHPPFQIDGNFGATAGIAEMLLQSHAGEVHVLPALPAAWPDGSVRGLRARGGLTVGITWSGGAATALTVDAAVAGPVRLRSTLLTRACLTDGERKVAGPAADGCVTFPAQAGRRYTAG